MAYPSVQQEVMQTKLILVLYRDRVDRSGSDIFESTEVSYTNEKAQEFLRKATKPCFTKLSQLRKELSQGSLANMHKNFDESTQAYERLTALENSRAKIQKDEQAALEAIEQKIENCLKTIDETKQALSDSMFWVKHYLAEMRDYLSAYDELLQHLKDRSKEQRYQQLLTKLEKEYSDCRNHPVYQLDTNQKRKELLEHLRTKHERERYQPTEADIKEALYMGW